MASGNGKNGASSSKRKAKPRRTESGLDRLPPQLHQFVYKKGKSGNPGGRHRGRRDVVKRVWDALEKVETDRKKLKRKGVTGDLFEHLIKRSFSDDRVLVALMNKLLPSEFVVEETADKQITIKFVEPEED